MWPRSPVRHRVPVAACLLLLLLGANQNPAALNRLLLERRELKVACEGRGPITATLPLSDPRALHVAKVLQLRDGDTLRVGIINGGIDDAAQLRWIWPAGSAGTWLQNQPRELRPQRLRAEEMLHALEWEQVLPEALELAVVETAMRELPPPRIDLLLATPQLGRLQRLLPQISQLGVGMVILCDAAGADKRTLGSELLKNPDRLRTLFLKGLAQSGDTMLPTVVLTRRLRSFLLEGELDALASPGHTHKIFVVPRGKQLLKAFSSCSEQERVLVAVGPDCGWNEPTETTLLAQAGFKPVRTSLRALSCEANTCAALGLAHAAMRRCDDSRQRVVQGY